MAGALVLAGAAAAAAGWGNWSAPEVSADGRHASATWLGAGGPDVCTYQCDACSKYCDRWTKGAIGCCSGAQCCCCSATAPSTCSVDQCVAISKGKCPSDECSAPTPAPPPATPVPKQTDGLAQINKLRKAAGKAPFTLCNTQGQSQKIAEYDAKNGKHAYTTKNGWDGVCAADFVGTTEQCETNGYNGGNDGLTWDNAVVAMQQSCKDALVGDHKCAAFGWCEGCSTSASGKTRNFYVASFC